MALAGMRVWEVRSPQGASSSERHTDDGVDGFGAGFHSARDRNLQVIDVEYLRGLGVDERVFEGGGRSGKSVRKWAPRDSSRARAAVTRTRARARRLAVSRSWTVSPIDVGVVQGLEGRAEVGGVALDAGVGPHEGLELESGDRLGTVRACEPAARWTSP